MARKKQCPFHKKLDCEDCRLQRTGVRWVGIDRRKEDYAECVFTCICDNLEGEGIAMRQMQAEMGQTKQAAIFQALAILVDSAQAKDELKRIIVNNFEGLQSLLGVASRGTTELDDLLAMVENEVEDKTDASRQITDQISV